jgi:hypothetical protein
VINILPKDTLSETGVTDTVMTTPDLPAITLLSSILGAVAEERSPAEIEGNVPTLLRHIISLLEDFNTAFKLYIAGYGKAGF